MQDAASCSSCQASLQTLSPVFLSCGDILCDQCAPRFTECPLGDQGKPFTPPAHIIKHLKGILRDTLDMQGERRVQELIERLKKVQIGEVPKQPVCATCGRDLIGNECSTCSPRCALCSTPLQNSSCPKCMVPPSSYLSSQLHVPHHPVPQAPVIHIPCPYPLPSNFQNSTLDELEVLYLSNREAAQQKICEMEPLRKELERLLQPKFPGCTLKAYGSGANGFTMVSSDFDLTIILPNPVIDSDQKCMILRQLEPLIRSQGYHIEDRLSARTPVLKCTHPSNIELDLSVGNLVAVRNSELLNTYAELDERVRALGIILKHWAKKRKIADAALGYLSSYSYIVLLIAYLQRTNPPLIPNLQADYYGCMRDMVEEHDCSFEKNVQRYKEMTERNKATVGELLVGFFRHYGYEFDWENACATMRLPNNLSKSDKNWRNGIAIEDPFELNRNLGDVASRKYQEIIDEFKWAAYLLYKGHSFESICSFGLMDSLV